jgi:hypothetical protein
MNWAVFAVAFGCFLLGATLAVLARSHLGR